ncbi:ImmA/IrrE family metallo-endopeptidase [Neoroseomonas lacus]|uniref:IrrE N-terminal-like domain-containing protein n=1 Tax=Neoroseomonas lacus TaxID=287609 RepID=A0A917KGR2_9PROT|nr:ImmA/IrrE family metallo-endopeptidase [Neoroseomonas lacus]GGJ10743.1 hypothetical protein GCM10011320_17330 [Neoroseomonas lacus]
MNARQAELPIDEGIDAILRDTADRIDEFYRAASDPGARPPWVDLFNRISSQTHMAPFNLMLADLQRPGARYVAFPDTWRDIGRQVKPASIPIIVLWPFCPVRCAYELADTTGDPVEDALLDRVFGEPVEVRAGLIDRVARHALKEDRIDVKSVSLASTRAGDARAVEVDPKAKGKPATPGRVVRVNSNLHPNAQFTTLVHELAHVYLGHLGGSGKKWPDRRPNRLDVREFEAEAVTFIVCKRFGLKSNSAEYLNGYIKENTIQHVSHSAIARAAGRIEQHAR